MIISDHVLDHLCAVVDRPDLSGTRYELLGMIGRGGMGTVYRARDTQLDREVALKLVESAANVGPVLTEARLIARLEHPGIVPVYDAGALPDGRGYYIMRRVEGVRMDEFLHGSPTMSERLMLFGKLCDVVAFAHSRGVVHCDLKPANIIVGKFGEVVVLDWGVATRIACADQPTTRLVAGTPPYMAPEQERGADIDPRSDIHALGVLMQELLPVHPPRVLASIAAKARSPQPDARYSRAEDLAADLRRYQDGLPVSAHRDSVWDRAARFVVRNRVLLLLMVAYVLVRSLMFILRPS